jgi:GT2 family glycosyltransferase
MSSITSPGFSDPHRRLTIVVVSWNVCDYLECCLRSLATAGVPAWAHVVVVDNASADGSAEMVARQFEFVTLIRAGANLGFTRGNNLALRHAETEYVLLLNPDTVVPGGALEALVARMDNDSTIGAIAPRQHSGDGAVQFEAAVNLPTVWNAFCDLAFLSRIFPKSRLFSRRTMGWWDHLDEREVPGLAGSALLLRCNMLRDIGLLDETMFCAEDMDLCRRIATAGWHIRYAGSVAITHFGGASVKRSDAGLQRQIAYQSFWLYLRKHDGPVTAARMTAMVFAVSLAAWGATGILRIVPGLPQRLMELCDRLHRLAASLLKWAVADKSMFRHPLAADPPTEYRGFAGTAAASEESPQ